jgi:positive regulator of sigma E activity
MATTGKRKVTSAVLVYVLLLLSLQIFLVTVAAEGLLGGEPRLAWVATAVSVVLAVIAALFYRFLRDG